jgi:hypothetical protein
MIVLLFPILLALFLVIERLRGQMALARFQRQLTAQGEKLTARDTS